MNLVKLFLLCWFVSMTNCLQAQSPYHFNTKREATLFAAGGVSAGVGMYFRSTTPLLEAIEIQRISNTEVNSFDRFATNNYSKAADRASDFFWGGSHLIPLLFLAGDETKKEALGIGMMFGEVFLLNTSLTVVVKYTTRRSRPFVYNSEVAIDKKLQKNARTSFLSGHTSMTAANCYFAAQVFSDYYPDSRWKPLVWSSAVVIPGIAGYLRIRAGKHFLTDTMAGYAMGAAIGILIPQLHKKDSQLTVQGGWNGAILKWRF